MYSGLNNEATNGEPSTEGSETETTDIVTAPTPNSYGSTLVEDKSAGGFYVPICGLVYYIMAFLGTACALSLRETLSIAIVDMVNQTTITEADIAVNINSDQEEECPKDPELENEGGEFDWNRRQQAIVLSAFYVGCSITQVGGIEK